MYTGIHALTQVHDADAFSTTHVRPHPRLLDMLTPFFHQKSWPFWNTLPNLNAKSMILSIAQKVKIFFTEILNFLLLQRCLGIDFDWSGWSDGRSGRVGRGYPVVGDFFSGFAVVLLQGGRNGKAGIKGTCEKKRSHLNNLDRILKVPAKSSNKWIRSEQVDWYFPLLQANCYSGCGCCCCCCTSKGVTLDGLSLFSLQGMLQLIRFHIKEGSCLTLHSHR